MPDLTLILTVAVGVGIFLASAFLRMVLKIRLSILLLIGYAAVFLLSIFVPNEFVAVAFDAGGVTTGPITVPFIMAFGIGLAALRNDGDAESDSFGMVACAQSALSYLCFCWGFSMSRLKRNMRRSQCPLLALPEIWGWNLAVRFRLTQKKCFWPFCRFWFSSFCFSLHF